MRSPVSAVIQLACALSYLSDEGRLHKTADALGLTGQVVLKIAEYVKQLLSTRALCVYSYVPGTKVAKFVMI